MRQGDFQTVGGKCPECGFLHPITPGKKCPLGKQKTPLGVEVNFESFFGDLRTILVSQIEKKNINDPKKLLGHVLVKITKIVEGYSE